MNELNKNLEGQVKIGTVNLDTNPEIAQTYSIVSIPTFILFKDGKIKTRLTGLQSKMELLNEINKL